jgi:hypothetical protein
MNSPPPSRGTSGLATLLLFAVGAGLVSGACADFEGLRVAGDGGAACTLARPPRPAPNVPLPSNPVDFTVVTWQAELGDRNDGGPPPYQSLGYDQDGKCTTADSGPSCQEPPWATAPHADGPGGIDNAVGASLYGADGGVATDQTRSADTFGVLELAIQVREFDQQDVDPHVVVAYYAVGYRRVDGGPFGPRWDGTDAWDVYTDWLVAPEGGGPYRTDQPLYEDQAGYVTPGDPAADGTRKRLLVSRLPLLKVGGAPLIVMSQVLVTGEIVLSGGRWGLENVVVTGRVSIDQVLHQVAFIRDPLTNTLYCRGQGQYAKARALACSYADVSGTGPDDGSRKCDAASWAFRYAAAEPVSLPLGIGPAAPDQPAASCPPGTSPLDDHCGP